LDVPVVPSALVLVVAPVDFCAAAGAGVGLASGAPAAADALSYVTGAITGAALDACSVGTFGTTIAEKATGADAAGARLAGAATGGSSSSGSERSKLEKVA
jgi:hypothetical protein